MPFNVQHCAKLLGTITAGGAGTTYAIKTDKNSDKKYSKSYHGQNTWMQMSCDGSFWPRPRSASESSEYEVTTSGDHRK